jgi:hypothetical protein
LSEDTPSTDPKGKRSVSEGEHTVYITPGAGWGETKPLVVRLCVGEGDVDKAPVLVEFSLGLAWSVDGAANRPPAWEELARRADLALTENGWIRTADWSHHVWPQPIARTPVSKSV